MSLWSPSSLSTLLAVDSIFGFVGGARADQGPANYCWRSLLAQVGIELLAATLNGEISPVFTYSQWAGQTAVLKWAGPTHPGIGFRRFQ